MDAKRFVGSVLGPAALVVAALMATAAPASAHCDGLDGPVVKAARQALAEGRVEPALAWVRADDEAEVREAFARTLEVRLAGGPAAELAERWFFETLVRVHRAGEGAPYTGLKPAGLPLEPGVAAAERALAEGSLDRVLPSLTAHVEEALRERFAAVQARAGHPASDVEAARAYVAAYVEWIHFVEALAAVVHEGPGHGAGSEEGHATGGGAHGAVVP